MSDDGTFRYRWLHDPRHPFAYFQHQLRVGERALMEEALKAVRRSRTPVAVGPIHWYRQHHSIDANGRPGTMITLEIPIRAIAIRRYDPAPMMAVAPENVYFPVGQRFSFWRRLRFLFTGKLMT